MFCVKSGLEKCDGFLMPKLWKVALKLIVFEGGQYDVGSALVYYFMASLPGKML